MTERLYYDDAYLTRFDAHIIERGCDPCEIYLDRTAFYPTSGGQPYDTGSVGGVPVIDVVEVGDLIQHRIARPVNTEQVSCEVNWERRFDHMQQHSGQHLLSAVLVELNGAQTVSFHLGAAVSTIDLDIPALSADQIRAAETRVNDLVFENRPLAVTYEEGSEVQGLRGKSNREGTLRIVEIDGLDRSACGGTHVRSTGEIGPVLLRKTEKIRGCVRVEFLCGSRAVRRARTDFDALERCARVFSAALDETPSLVAAQQEKLVNAERSNQRLVRELAQLRGKELYRTTEPDAAGRRLLLRRLPHGPIGDEARAEAQAFTSAANAAYILLTEQPALVLLATSKDSGLHAGNTLRPVLETAGGRGGGNIQLAQGTLPSPDALDQVAAALDQAVRG